MRCFRIILALIVGLAAPALAIGEEAASARPELVIESSEEGVNSLWVEVPSLDGSTRRQLLRETAAALTTGRTGWDPARQAAFANWTEDSAPWSAWSRDGGRSWSTPAALLNDLRLLDGHVPPGQTMPAIRAGLAAPADNNLYIVQFRTISLPEWRASLADLGGEVLAFFPHNAHIVRLSPSLLESVSGLDFVERIEPYEPSYRLEPALREWIEGGTDALETPEGELRVRAVSFEWGPAGKAPIKSDAEAAGARVAEYWASGHVLELWVNRDQLRKLAASNAVMWIDRWSPAENDMDLVRQDSGADYIESNFNYCGQDVRGEVLDNGIQDTHQDFDGIILHGSKDTQSHGTNTYGIVFGNGARDGDGNAQATGHVICSPAQGIFADYGFLGDRFLHTQELKNAPYFASFQTNSWGNARTTAYTSVSQEMDDIIFRLDIAILQSQSNAGNTSSRPQAWAKNILAVGGIRHFNTLSRSDDAWNNGASTGPAADGRIKPDISYWYDSIFTTTTNNGYTSSFGGTSAATPEAAGVVGLIVQMWADNVWNTNPTGNTVFEKQPHFSTIKALTVNTARQYPFSGTSHDLTRTHQGWGTPNAQLAKDRAANSFVVDEEEILTVGQTASYDVTVPAAMDELKVTMVYPDPPGTTSSSLHRINNVDLKVTSPGGTVYHGNVGLNASTVSSPGGSPNNVDTVENVFITNPAQGTWTIDVTAAQVNQDGHLDTPGDDVVFALVVTGASFSGGECGNGIKEFGEDCDGTDLGGASCSSLGCTGGTLACDAFCSFDTTNCTGCPSCDDDGVCEAFEDCNNCSNDCRSGTSATCGNAICETANGEDCLTCPVDCNGRQGGKPANRYCCGPGTGGTNPVTCSDSRCTGSGNTCLASNAPPSCCGDGTCEGDEDSFNCEIDCGPPASCGDGTCSAGEDSCTCSQDCGTPPNSEVPNLTCSDGQDNDCDLLIDCDDEQDCATDPLCDCSLKGSSCVFDSDCCSEKCRGPSGGKTCK